jgi:hypothetical protein
MQPRAKMNTLHSLINSINHAPETTKFNDVIHIIEEHYNYSPTLFRNGADEDCIINQAKENEGSCKIFSFAQLHQLTKTQTLHCFGHYYRDEVLNHPNESNHANIRTFMKYGWDQIHFDAIALTPKTQ